MGIARWGALNKGTFRWGGVMFCAPVEGRGGGAKSCGLCCMGYSKKSGSVGCGVNGVLGVGGGGGGVGAAVGWLGSH